MTIMLDMLAEFAKTMKENPSNWWNHFEYEKTSNEWRALVSAHDACGKLLNGYSIRRRRRTITRFDREGKPVELPARAPKRGDMFIDVNPMSKEEYADAKAWRDYFRALMEVSDE